MSSELWPRVSRGIPRLSGKIAVVTGAAHGIGRALAIRLRDRGCDLALVDVDELALTRLERELRQTRACGAVSAHVADISDRECMRQVAHDILAVHGAVHVLVNSAGVAHEASFIRTSLEDWDRIVAINLLGVIHGCHYFLPHLAKVERAHIVNISSLLGIVGMPGQCAYSATKFAVRGFSESLQEELRVTSIGLTLVYPGAVSTGIMLRARGDDPQLLQQIDNWYERHALRPERVAERIVRAIERGSPRLIIGTDSKLADLLKRLIPVAGNALFVNAAIRMLGLEYMRAKRLAQWRESMLEKPLMGDEGTP